MLNLPVAEAEMAALAHLAASDEPQAAEAARLLARLKAPLRAAIAGGAGKSALLAFLLGERLMPRVNAAGVARPPVIVAHGDPAKTYAGWWDGRRTAFEGRAAGQALSERPDYVEFHIPHPLLDQLSFFVMPTLFSAEDRARQVAWLTPRADFLLWCKPAPEPWRVADQELWALVAPQIQALSILVATQADRLGGESHEDAANRFASALKGSPRQIVPIATLKAIEAAPGGILRDEAAWAASGARGILLALVDAARAARAEQIAAARLFLSAATPPAAEAARDEAPPPSPAPPPEKPAAILALDAELAALIRRVEGNEGLEPAPFITAAATAFETLQPALEAVGAGWLSEYYPLYGRRLQSLKAAGGPRAAEDAAGLYLQLAKEVALARLPADEAR